MKALITASRLRARRGCQYRDHLVYGLGIKPAIESDTLRFGTLMHRGLEAWWLAAQRGDADMLTPAIAAMSGEADPFERAKAEVLMRGYDARWAPTIGEYEVLAVEAEFTAPLVNPQTGRASRIWDLAGKLDAIVRDLSTGRVLFVEHKTSSEDLSDGGAYWKRLRMDGQVSIYYAGAKALGHDVAGCIYDVIKKPALRPLEANSRRAVPETPGEYALRIAEAIADAPDKFYRRGEVVRLERELDEAAWDVWQTAQQIHESDAAERWPRNPDACFSYGRECPFFEHCTGCASLDDASRFRRVEHVHSELSASLNGAAQV